MHVGIVNAALAAIDDEIDGMEAYAGPNLERLCSVMTDKPSPKNRQTKPQARAESKMNPAFDAWLENKLHSMFDAVAAEPLPADLLKLLDRLDKKMADGEDDKKNGK